MHYIEYLPGGIARISDKPAIIPVKTNNHQCQSEDVNLLSRIVVKFNRWLTHHYHASSETKWIELRTHINNLS